MERSYRLLAPSPLVFEQNVEHTPEIQAAAQTAARAYHDLVALVCPQSVSIGDSAVAFQYIETEVTEEFVVS
ncbi:hypothetical protein [Streptomyces sp. NBC_01198]|uniref:hypothetical protein n=1 Tax=Streptomyces sp. NBC_01198 TaxID=2903769 RepID=UPI002E1573A4|nr:hypothetical protein OG702_32085 [Streptomyces sp. NBC_01198]